MITSIIVDDEPRALELLTDYVSRYSEVELLASFRDPLRALDYLRDHHVDLIFLDIDMPGLSGISLASLITEKIQIIFTTAYSEYAVKSYDLEALDYLLKPISFERFIKAVQKACSKTTTATFNPSTSNDLHIISLKSGFEIHRVLLSDIQYLEKDGNYMTYHLLDQKIIVRQSIQDALSILSAPFIQVHKSFIVALPHIKLIDKEGLRIAEVLIPIGNKYRDELMKKLL